MVRVDIESIIMASGPVPSVVVLRERRPSSESDAPLRALTIQTGAYEAAAIGGGMDQGKAAARPIAHDLLLTTVQQLGAKVERVEIRRWDAPVFYADVVLGRDITSGEMRGDANGTRGAEGRGPSGGGAEGEFAMAETASSNEAAEAGGANGAADAAKLSGGGANVGEETETPHAAQAEIRIDARPSDAIALAARSNAPIYVEDDVMNRAGNISLQSSGDENAAQEEIERFDEFVQGLSPDDF